MKLSQSLTFLMKVELDNWDCLEAENKQVLWEEFVRQWIRISANKVIVKAEDVEDNVDAHALWYKALDIINGAVGVWKLVGTC